MKQMLKGYLSLLALVSACAFMGTATANREILIRSQSVDAARELVGWTNHINLFDMGGLYGSFAITAEYAQSFRSERLARSLFGTSLTSIADCNTSCNTGCNDNDGFAFNVSGSCVTNRGAFDLMAENFGLSPDFASVVSVRPKIQNFLVDFDLYLGLDEWLCGLWFRVHAPVVYAKWKLNLCENVTEVGTSTYSAGYFAPADVAVSAMNQSFSSYLNGSVPTLNNGVVFEPLARERVGFNNVNGSCSTSCNSNHTTKLSDIQFALGWNFWQDEDYHVGLGIRAAAPTGTRIGSSPLLFQPIVGNGHHWELGAMFTSHYTFWRSCDYDQSFGLYVDMNITHLFNTRQCRTFDICGAGPLSRYLLLEQLTSTVTEGLGGGDPFVAATSQFNSIFTPAANITTRNVKVSIPYQLDLAAMFNYTNCGFSWDLGYNLWATGCEKIKFCSNACQVDPNTYAIKGDANVFGFRETSPSEFVALSATESRATIFAGTNGTSSCSSLTALNTNIDNPQLAQAPEDTALVGFPGGVAPAAQTNTSIQAVTLTDASLDIQGARRKGLTNKVFTHFSYTWEECDCYIPFLGIGGFAEFGSNGKNGCDTACGTTCPTSPVISSCATSACNTGCDDNGCRRASLSQWGIWLKGGVSFN